ncbi:MAG TPA: hypothetical protein VIE65_13080 [Methylobacter sp.]
MKIFKKLIVSIGLIGTLFAFSGTAQADDWGCQVLLCLANPKGAMAVTPCVPPIMKLLQEMAKPWSSFSPPTCDMSSGSSSAGGGSSANGKYEPATEQNCPPQYAQYYDYMIENIQMHQYVGCSGLTSYVEVNVNNAPFSKTWMIGTSGTLTEYNISDPTASAQFDADYANYQVAAAAAAAQAAQQAAWNAQF